MKTVKLILFCLKLNKPGILSKMHQHLLNSLINTSYLGCLIHIKAGVKMTRWGLSGRLFLEPLPTAGFPCASPSGNIKVCARGLSSKRRQHGVCVDYGWVDLHACTSDTDISFPYASVSLRRITKIFEDTSAQVETDLGSVSWYLPVCVSPLYRFRMEGHPSCRAQESFLDRIL